jgi:predicted amidohydrolase
MYRFTFFGFLLIHAIQPQLLFAQQLKTVKVAAIQCSSDLGEIEKNSKKLEELTIQAAKEGAKIVVWPETAVTGYLSQDNKENWHLKNWPIESQFTGKDPTPFAESKDGKSVKRFAKLAKEQGIYLTIPFLEIENGKFYNTVCLANPKGDIVAHYRKLTPWPLPEKSWATAGNRGIQTYDTEYGRVGLGICFDIHTILEKYQNQKLWALLYPIAWVDVEHPAEWFQHRLTERVKPFNLHVIGANWSVDKKQSWRGYGFSTIINNKGEIASQAKSLYGSEIVYANLEVK